MTEKKGQNYLVSEDVIKAVEGVIKLLNSKDLKDIARANGVVPSLLEVIRASPFSEDDLEQFLAQERQEVLDSVIAEIMKFEKECNDDVIKTPPEKTESVTFYKTCAQAARFIKARITGLKKE